MPNEISMLGTVGSWQNVEENKHFDSIMQVDGTNVSKDQSCEDCTAVCEDHLDEFNVSIYLYDYLL